ncbi:hypothetical protein ACQ4N7_28465 [Nodosilinea sp. AN01ver1]|uniref:hypothetical protein n=1 Tax=Nodosilinea sp. AN01ver1 TaxID=3423362 RepID=UPI003D30F358
MALRIPVGHKLPLFSQQGQPDTPLRVEPDLLHYGPGQRWRCIDGYSDRSFGGSFAGPEIDYIVAEFRDWAGAISPGQFEVVAKAAIKACRVQGQGVAA